MSHNDSITLADLAVELRDFLELPGDLDLPKLQRVQCVYDANWPARGWRCRAAVAQAANDSVGGYEALAEWAALTSGRVEASRAYGVRDGGWPSGLQRTLTVSVTVAGVEVELYALVEGTFEIPEHVEAVQAHV